MAFLLALVMALALCACAKPTPIAAGKTTVGVKDGETVGQGATAFSVEVKDAEGKATNDFTVQTDEKTVGAALQALNIISRRGERLRPVYQGGHRHHGGLRQGRHLLGVLHRRTVCPHRRGSDGGCRPARCIPSPWKKCSESIEQKRGSPRSLARRSSFLHKGRPCGGMGAVRGGVRYVSAAG